VLLDPPEAFCRNPPTCEQRAASCPIEQIHTH
jgi:hypothetical protein